MAQDNSDLKKLLAGRDSPKGAKPEGEASGAPVGAPQSTPQQNEGDQAQADAKIALAMKLLSQALPAYGSDSEKGSSLVEMISKGHRTFGVKLENAEKLIPAELKMLMASADMKSPEEQAGAAPSGGGAPAPMKMAA